MRFKNAEFAAHFSRAYANAVENEDTISEVVLVQQESQIPIKSPEKDSVLSPEPKSPPPQATFSFGDKPAAAPTPFGGFSFGNNGENQASGGFNFGSSRNGSD